MWATVVRAGHTQKERGRKRKKKEKKKKKRERESRSEENGPMERREERFDCVPFFVEVKIYKFGPKLLTFTYWSQF